MFLEQGAHYPEVFLTVEVEEEQRYLRLECFAPYCGHDVMGA